MNDFKVSHKDGCVADGSSSMMRFWSACSLASVSSCTSSLYLALAHLLTRLFHSSQRSKSFIDVSGVWMYVHLCLGKGNEFSILILFSFAIIFHFQSLMKRFGMPCPQMLAQTPLRIITRKLTSEFESSSRCADWFLTQAVSEVTAHLGWTLDFLLTLSASAADLVPFVCFLSMRVCILTRGTTYFASRGSQLARTFIKHVEFASDYVILSTRIIATGQKSSVTVPLSFLVFRVVISDVLKLMGGSAPSAVPMQLSRHASRPHQSASAL